MNDNEFYVVVGLMVKCGIDCQVRCEGGVDRNYRGGGAKGEGEDWVIGWMMELSGAVRNIYSQRTQGILEVGELCVNGGRCALFCMKLVVVRRIHAENDSYDTQKNFFCGPTTKVEQN